MLTEARFRLRHGESQHALDLVCRASRAAPNRADVATFQGVVLTDRKSFAEAAEAFDYADE